MVLTPMKTSMSKTSVPQSLSDVKCTTDHVVTNDVENLVHNNGTFTGTNSLNAGSQSNDIGNKRVKLFDISSHSDDRFINNLLSKSVAKQCDAFKQWESQTDFDFGFIPLTDLALPESKILALGLNLPLISTM